MDNQGWEPLSMAYFIFYDLRIETLDTDRVIIVACLALWGHLILGTIGLHGEDN